MTSSACENDLKHLPAAARHTLDVRRLRADFPILDQCVEGRPLVYLDNAATTQKPCRVIEAMNRYYLQDNANVHRGVHALSVRATSAYENARARVRDFLDAGSTQEIIFVKGTTEAINLVAQSYGRANLRAGDRIVITAMEHHSNIVPWQILCEQTGAELCVAEIDDDGNLLVDSLERLIDDRTKLVALAYVSNALGTINPVREVVELAHKHGVPVLVDGAQAAPHLPVSVRELDCDFFALSAHKMYGPTGIGVLYARQSLLEKMPPYQGGGDMIKSVTFEKTIYNELPFRFEAGTPNIAGAIGLAAAVEYLLEVGIENIQAYEQELLEYATAALAAIPEARLIGTAAHKASVLSFVVEGVHPHDLGTILDHQGIAIRAGHHCAQPVMQRFKVPATARASLGLYNTKEEIDALAQAVAQVVKMFS